MPKQRGQVAPGSFAVMDDDADGGNGYASAPVRRPTPPPAPLLARPPSVLTLMPQVPALEDMGGFSVDAPVSLEEFRCGPASSAADLQDLQDLHDLQTCWAAAAAVLLLVVLLLLLVLLALVLLLVVVVVLLLHLPLPRPQPPLQPPLRPALQPPDPSLPPRPATTSTRWPSTSRAGSCPSARRSG